MLWWLLSVSIYGLFRISVSTSVNQPPSFVVPTSPVTVSENEHGQALLYTLTVSDPDGDLITCLIQTTDPSTSDFGLWYNTTDYGLYVLAGSLLDHTTTPLYTVTTACSDNSDSTSMNVTVNVLPNSPPTFSNLPGSVTLNANSVDIGDVVYTVAASDTDSTSLSFSMTSLPVTPAMFSIDTVSGKVTATQDLKYAVDNAYDLTITVSDSKETTTSNLVLQINNVNTGPVINNLPDSINIAENSGSNTVIFTPAITEPDSGDTTDVTYVVSPSGYASKFKYQSNGFWIVRHNTLDYEDQNVFTVTFTVTDGKVTNGNYVLTINVIDVNEPCVFASSYYYITMQEGNVGSGSANPGFIVTDDDTGSSFTFALQNTLNAALFSIDPLTGNVSFVVNYDVDVTHPNSTSFLAYCYDNLGSRGQTNLYITIEDVNDNPPSFGATPSLTYFDQTMPIPYHVITLSAIDADSGDNALLSYTWTTSTAGGNYFTLSPSGVILLTADPQSSLTYGTSFRFVVTALDSGYPALSGTTTLDLIYQEVNATTAITTTTTTTVLVTDTSESFLDEPGNIAVVILCVALGLVLCGITAYSINNMLKKKRLHKLKSRKVEPAREQKTMQIKPAEEQHPKPGKALFNFWRPDDFHVLSTTKTNGAGQPRVI